MTNIQEKFDLTGQVAVVTNVIDAVKAVKEVCRE